MTPQDVKENSTQVTSNIKITIAKDNMSATVLIRPGADGEPMPTVDEINEQLNISEIIYGLDKDAIQKIVEEKIYNQPVKIATGKKPERGRSAEFQYKFETQKDLKPQEDEKGNIDYKNINFIQNVGKDDVLATKVPPQPGRKGMTVGGKELSGPMGKDLPFKNGINTTISDDGFTLTANCDGAIVFTHGKISVNDVTMISGDVDFNTGNIDCRGSVRVNGSVRAGFTIKTNGDIEISGNVEDCNMYSKGNILIKGGIIGKGDGEIVADGDITFKFAEGMYLFSKSNIYAGDEIINCKITANNEIIVKSRNGKIIGGDLKARKLIRANDIGTDAGTATIIRVAHDTKLMSRLTEIQKELNRLGEDKLKIKEALGNLYRLEIDNKLSKGQQSVLEKFEDFKKELPQAIEELNKEKLEVEKGLAELLDARIIVEGKLYSGVRAYFGIVYLEVIESREICELSSDGNRVHVSAYRKEK